MKLSKSIFDNLYLKLEITTSFSLNGEFRAQFNPLNEVEFVLIKEKIYNRLYFIIAENLAIQMHDNL